MLFQIKNIILYTPTGDVAGFLEIKTDGVKTIFRLKQDIGKDFFLSLVIGGKTQVIKITENITNFTINKDTDLRKEIFVCLIKRNGEAVETVASGVINLSVKKETKTDPVTEIDNAIKKVCGLDENGNSLCENCPYREYFFAPNKQQAN